MTTRLPLQRSSNPRSMEIDLTPLIYRSWFRVSMWLIEEPISTQCCASASRITRVRQTKIPAFQSAPSRTSASARGRAGFSSKVIVTCTTFRERLVVTDRQSGHEVSERRFRACALDADRHQRVGGGGDARRLTQRVTEGIDERDRQVGMQAAEDRVGTRAMTDLAGCPRQRGGGTEWSWFDQNVLLGDHRYRRTDLDRRCRGS